MRNRRVLLLDLGFDENFEQFSEFVMRSIQNINIDLGDSGCTTDLVRSRDWDVSTTAFTSPCDVMHVMAHAGAEDADPVFSGGDETDSLRLSDVPAHLLKLRRRGLAASTIIADGCRTATGVWQKSVRDCLQDEVTYVGTTASVGWYDGTIFASAFYGALLRRRGKGQSSAEWGFKAAQDAIEAYRTIAQKSCPYKVMRLLPSREAKRNFG